MSKYFIGYPLPAAARQALEQLRPNIMEGVMGKPEDLHVTALYLGEKPADTASRILDDLPGNIPPVPTGFRGFARFGGGSCLVVTLLDPTVMLRHVHGLLKTAEGHLLSGDSKWDYTPHITLLKNRKAFCRATVPSVAFMLDKICLYEKPSGGEYAIIATKELKS